MCVCLQEIQIRENERNNAPSQYNLYTSGPTYFHGQERGSAILTHETVHATQINLETTLQAVAVKIRTKKKDYTICSLYLPNRRTQSETQVTYSQLVNLLNQLTTPFLLLGDMNAWSTDWNNTRTNETGRLFERLFLEHPIILLNNGEPTHETHRSDFNTSSVIDLSICSEDCALDFEYSIDESLHNGNHYPIHLDLIETETSTTKKYASWNLKEAKWAMYKNLTETESSNNSLTVEEELNEIYSIIDTAAQATIPRKTNLLNRPPITWWNPHLTELSKAKRCAERAKKRNLNPYTLTQYNRARAHFRYHDRKYYREAHKKLRNSITWKSNWDVIWRQLKKLNGKYKKKPTPILHKQNTSIREPKEVSDEFVNYFASVGTGKENREKIDKNLELQSPMQYYNQPITNLEFQAMLSSTKETAPGIDDVSYSMIKQAHPTLQKKILKLYNKILDTGIFPDIWSNSVIIPIHKQGKDPTDPSSYRPISLTCCICKLLEKIINYRLMWYLENNKFLNNIQSGYRKHRSTTDQLATFTTNILHSFTKKHHTIVVFFDLQKAYDTARIDIIIQNLKSAGIKGKLLVFIWNFLSNRKITVRIEDQHSEKKRIQFGIPQGSVLSCTCFILAINNICNTFPKTIKAQLYVDDLCISISGIKTQHLCRQVQLAINELEKWSSETGFNFSKEKTVTMHICNSKRCKKESPELKMKGTILQHVKQYKYLGMIIDDSLTFKTHIEHIKRKAAKSLNILKIISNPNNGADRNSLIRIYLALTKPILDYGSEIYSSCCKTYLNYLEPIQNQAMRISTGAYRTTPIDSLQAESGLKPLKEYRDIKNFNYMLRLLANPDESTLNKLKIDQDEQCPIKKRKPYILLHKEILEKYNFNMPPIQKQEQETYPPWLTNPITCCLELFTLKKKDNNTTTLKNHFLAHTEKHHQDKIYYTDGSKTANGTASAYTIDGDTKNTKLPELSTIYTAELHAIYAAIKDAINKTFTKITIFTDSRSTIQGIMKYGNDHPIIVKIKDKANQSNIQITICWVPSHCGILGNETADEAARLETEAELEYLIPLPKNDIQAAFKAKVNNHLKSKWESLSTPNKLRKIKCKRGPFQNSHQNNRMWESKLARLRFGHTKLTHNYLLNNIENPICSTCTTDITVEHFLVHCRKYEHQRRKYLYKNNNPINIKDILGEDGPIHENGPLMKFLKETDIYHQI